MPVGRILGSPPSDVGSSPTGDILYKETTMEELKQIVEVINSLGEGAKVAFIWWLCLSYGSVFATTVVKCMTVTVVVPFSVYWFARGMKAYDDAVS